jgi:hypothetical protein
MRLFLAATALGAMLVASVGAAAPGAAKPRKLTARGPVLALAADGDRAAFDVGLSGDCATLSVWAPTRGQVVRLRPRSRCDGIHRNTHALALAGTRAAWLWTTGGNFIETIIISATLTARKPVNLAAGLSDDIGGISGSFARPPVGDGTLLVFPLERRCGEFEDAQYPCPPGRKTGDIVAATLWRIGGRGPCPGTSSGPVRGCSRVANADGELSALAVDGGRIAVRTETEVKLLTAAGRSLQAFPVRPRAAVLSGNRIALRTANAVEIYDTGTGGLVKRFPATESVRLQDLDRGILVTASGGTVTLRRLGAGRTTIRVGGVALAQLERPGLFVAAQRRLTFTPMRDVLRLLSG